MKWYELYIRGQYEGFTFSTMEKAKKAREFMISSPDYYPEDISDFSDIITVDTDNEHFFDDWLLE